MRRGAKSSSVISPASCSAQPVARLVSSRSASNGAPPTSASTPAGVGANGEIARSGRTRRVGTGFSFFRWKDARARLEAYYHERGSSEARLATRRVPVESPDGKGVELEYVVRPGPRTTVVVEGF